MKTLLLKRDGAIGDCLLMTPIIKRAVDEGWRVWVQTKCGEVFKNNPYVDRIFDLSKGLRVRNEQGQFKVVDLNLAYEKRPKMHIIDAYSEAVFRDRKTERWPLYLFSPQITMEGMFFWKPFIVIHAGVGWENRTFSREFWLSIIADLIQSGHSVVTVGNNTDLHDFNLKDELNGALTYDLHGKLSIQELAYVIYKAKLFIGPDSAPLHIAQTASTPCIGLFTCALPEYRLVSPHAVAVIPKSIEGDEIYKYQDPYRRILECHGCLHDEPPPVTYVGCRRGDFICVRERITPEMVMEKVREVLDEKKASSPTQ